jgi:hypothetical protein
MSYPKPPAAQGPDQNIMEHISPEIPDMGIVVYRGATPVETDFPGIEGLEGL